MEGYALGTKNLGRIEIVKSPLLSGYMAVRIMFDLPCNERICNPAYKYFDQYFELRCELWDNIITTLERHLTRFTREVELAKEIFDEFLTIFPELVHVIITGKYKQS